MLLKTIKFADTTNPSLAAAAFERAFEKTGSAAIEDFLPPQSDPQYPSVLAQRLRVDLRLHWAIGCRKCLDDYRHLYPGAGGPGMIGGHRARGVQRAGAAGEHIEPREYESRYRIDVNGWTATDPKDLVILPVNETRTIARPRSRAGELPSTDGGHNESPAFTVDMPKPGQRFLPFRFDSRTRPGEIRPRIPRPSEATLRSSGGAQGRAGDGCRAAIAGLPAAHEHRSHLCRVSRRTVASHLHALLWFGDTARVIADIGREPKKLPHTGRGLLSTLFETRLNGSAPTKTEHEAIPFPVEEPPALAAWASSRK